MSASPTQCLSWEWHLECIKAAREQALLDAVEAVKALYRTAGKYAQDMVDPDEVVAAIEALRADRGNGGVTTMIVTGPAADRIREAREEEGPCG